VRLEIEDGRPWYLSPNVQVVSIENPDEEVIPTAGVPSLLRATVRNTGQSSVENAVVRFYWANPALGFDRTTANRVGTAFVSLGGGQTENVLCLSAWDPVLVNEGHECVLAEAFHPNLDPLPSGPAFNVPRDRHVAQRNLSVVQARNRFFRFFFEVHNPQRKARSFTITAQQGELEQLRVFEKLLGDLLTAKGSFEVLGFTPSMFPDADELDNLTPQLDEVLVDPHGKVGFSLAGELEGEAAFVLITQAEGEREVGGLGVVVHQEEA
jgi:hypothetical protein